MAKLGLKGAPTQTKPIDDDRLPMILTGQALLSLRDSGYSLPAALAEVIDNSIEAHANNIRIQLDEAVTHGKKHVHRIIVSDDGDGMDVELFQRYLQIGFSTRYMSKNTIGKYGVGAKLAALNYAKRIDVWSRGSAGEAWQHVFFDLESAIEEERATGRFGGLAKPRPADIPADLQSLVADEGGTLVVWSHVDRLEHGRLAADFDTLVVDLQQELSRIFREFLDGGIKVEVNKKSLLPHDPLFLMRGTWAESVLRRYYDKREEPSKYGSAFFEATLIADEEIRIRGSKVRLRVTLYPPAVTRTRGAGGDRLATQLRVPENEGAISFMRLGREIAYNNVPKIFGTAVQNADRFVGVELSFAPELDEYFGVRNVKRGVEPHGELRTKVRDALTKHIPQARKLLEDRWGVVARDSRDHEGEHAPIMEAVRVVDKTMPKPRTPTVAPDAVQQQLTDLARDTGRSSPDEQREYVERIRSLPFVLESIDYPGKEFVDIKHLNNQVIIRVNTRHRFYRELWHPLQEIAGRDPGTVSGEDAVRAARRAVEGLALMVVAYGKAQSMSNTPDQFDELTSDWGKFVDTLMGKVKDVL